MLVIGTILFHARTVIFVKDTVPYYTRTKNEATEDVQDLDLVLA